MAEFVYVLCALTSSLCALLLVRSYRRNRVRLLLWSSLCFVGLALNNVLLLVDLAIGPAVDLSLPRALTALAGVLCLAVGSIFEAR